MGSRGAPGTHKLAKGSVPLVTLPLSACLSEPLLPSQPVGFSILRIPRYPKLSEPLIAPYWAREPGGRSLRAAGEEASTTSLG